MGWGTGNNNGSSAMLRIISGAKLPEKAVKNSLFVKTEDPITKSVVSDDIEQIDSLPVEKGTVAVCIGDKSGRKPMIAAGPGKLSFYVHPLWAKVCDSESFKDVDAWQSTDGTEWVQIGKRSGNVILFDKGNQNIPVTGGWKVQEGSSGGVDDTIHGGYVSYGDYNFFRCETVNAVDLSPYKTIEVAVSKLFLQESNCSLDLSGIGINKSFPIGKTGAITIPIEDINGTANVKVALIGNGTSNFEITKIELR